MGLTLVTSFFRLPEKRDRDYLGLFDELAAVGLPVVVFFDAALAEGLARVSRHPNVTVVPSRLEESWTSRLLAAWPDLTLPGRRNEEKDSRAFLTLVNAKLDYLLEAQRSVPSSHYAWIDFGVLHVVPPSGRAGFLERLRKFPLPARCLMVPGCWDRPEDLEALWDRISWRFCGGFLLADRESLARLCARYRQTFAEEVGVRRALTWEVNIWALLEARGVPFQWYRADHDDSLVPG